jgi:two-component system, sensor histidine kinase
VNLFSWVGKNEWLSGIEPDQFERLVRVTITVSIMSTLGAVILALQFVGGSAAFAVLVWLAAFSAVSLARVVAGLYYLRTAARQAPTEGWMQWALGSTLLHAALWGLSSVVLLSRGSAEAESLLHVILVAVAMGSAVHLAGLYPILVAYVILVLSPLVLRDVYIGGGYHLFLAVLSALIGLYTLLNGRNQSHMITEIVAQRRRNAELIEALRLENQRTDTARRSAEHANAAMTRFFAAANHDLRQPLNAMGLLAATLHTRGAAVDVDAVSGHLVECVDGMTQVVDELLDISRLDAGSVALQRSSFALDGLLQELARTYRPLAESKGLRLDIGPSRMLVHSDRTLLARVVSNLLSNAIRYTERGAVRVSVRDTDADVELAVEDSGIGIAAEELPRIFEEFYQVGNPARDRRLGLGLGLATVKRLSDLLGLDVSVQSTPGTGSRFGLRLPHGVQDEALAFNTHAARATTDPLLRRHVLVIEDDADSRAALLGLLQAWGCVAQGVADGTAALACVAAGFRPDAVLADLRLAGGASGIAAIEALRAALSPDLPALVVTGDVGSERARAAQAQGYAVLAKPVKVMALRAFLGEAFATT